MLMSPEFQIILEPFEVHLCALSDTWVPVYRKTKVLKKLIKNSKDFLDLESLLQYNILMS